MSIISFQVCIKFYHLPMSGDFKFYKVVITDVKEMVLFNHY